MITVSQHQLLRYTLGRQGLIERQSSTALHDFGVLHCTDSTTPYLSLLARIEDFKWEYLADALYEERSFARLRCMRGTIHLVPSAQTQTIHACYDLREDDPFPPFEEYGISRDEARETRAHIQEALQQHGAQSSVSIKKVLDPSIIKEHKNRYGGKTTNIALVLQWMWNLGLLESGGGVSDWRSKDQHYRLAAVPPPNLSDAARRAADIELARWYFDLYAPAAFEDWTWWTGFTAARARSAFEALKPELVEVQAEGFGNAMWLPAAHADDLAETPDLPPEMIRLLPYEDALIKAYKTTRRRFYDAPGLAEDVAFTRAGEAEPTLWVDGRIVGLWEWVKKANEPMTVMPFAQMTKALRKRIKPEAERIQRFIEASHLLWSS